MRFETRIAELVDFNPSRPLKRNALAPFVDMAALPQSQRDIASLSEREFTGGGSRFRNGDTLFARITPCLENGKTAKVGVLPAGITAHGSTEFIVMAAKAPEFDEDFVYYLARHPDFRKFAEARMEGTSGRQRVSWQSLSEYTFPFPPPVQRKRIGCVLRTLDDKIALNRRINQTLEAMAQAIFKSWFVDFDPVKAKIAAKAKGRDPLRAAMTAISGKPDAELDTLPPAQFAPLAATAALFPDEMEDSELGEIPKGWTAQSMAQLTTKIGSGSTPRGGKEVYIDEGIALIRSQNVYDSLFVWEGLARITDEAAAQLRGVTVQQDDVLLNITGASILRTCVVLPDVLPARVNQHVAIIRAKAGVPARFLHQHLLLPETKNHLLGLNAGGSREAVTKAHIESLKLLVPSAEILGAFGALVTPMFKQVESCAREMQALAELRDTLLPKLLSGELQVQSTEAEVAA
jgi:type I restriction enzyme S subunit